MEGSLKATRSTVAFATCSSVPDLDDDDLAVVAVLAARGIDVVPAVWDDAAVDWERFDLTVLRSTWDYTDRVEAFVRWAAAVPRLANGFETVSWNVDKRYLADVAAAGVPVVATSYVAPGDPLGELPGGEVVVKPAVSAGSRDTLRLSDRARVAEHVEHIHASGRTAMIQPYLGGVDAAGETAVVFLGGTHSHAARKGPLLPLDGDAVQGLYARETMAPRVASPAELEVAHAALDVVPGETLYARIDLLPGPDEDPVVLEVEVTEPSLFLRLADGAPDRFATAIQHQLAVVVGE